MIVKIFSFGVISSNYKSPYQNYESLHAERFFRKCFQGQPLIQSCSTYSYKPFSKTYEIVMKAPIKSLIGTILNDDEKEKIKGRRSAISEDKQLVLFLNERKRYLNDKEFLNDNELFLVCDKELVKNEEKIKKYFIKKDYDDSKNYELTQKVERAIHREGLLLTVTIKEQSTNNRTTEKKPNS